MIDIKIIKPQTNSKLRLNLDSYINEANTDTDSKVESNPSTNEDYLKPQAMIDFKEVISSNLSVIHSNICQESSTLHNKIHFRQEVLINEKPASVQSDKLMLPTDSNINSEATERPTFRKPSLSPSSYVKGQKSRSRGSNGKLDQKQNSEYCPVTQKHVRIRSENTIRNIPDEDKQSTQLQERNPEMSFQNAERLLTELSRQFQYAGDFSLIRKEIVELALSKNLSIMQNTSEFVTIKASSKIDYCQCLIKSCLNMEESGAIFQLKNSVYKRNKAKFILISGNEKVYQKFFRAILIQLWNMKCLRLKKNDMVEFYVKAEKESGEMKLLKKEYVQLYNELSGLSGEAKSSGKSQPQSLIRSIKQNLSKLRGSSKKISQKMEQKFEQVLEYNQKVNKKYTQLKEKLFCIDQSIYSDRQNVARQLQTEIYYHEFPVWKLFGYFYKGEFEAYRMKCGEILREYSLRRIFVFLEIQEQYSLFVVQKGRISGQQQSLADCYKVKSCQIFTKTQPNNPTPKPVPYQQCIKLAESLNICPLIPSKILQKLSLFYKQLKLCYSQLYSEKSYLKTSSMDNELPVTIFILLMAELNDKRSVAMNLLGKVRWMLKWVEWQEGCADIQMDSSSMKPTCKESFAEGKKVLTMLDAAFVFVIKDWKQHEGHQEASVKEGPNQKQDNNQIGEKEEKC